MTGAWYGIYITVDRYDMYMTSTLSHDQPQTGQDLFHLSQPIEMMDFIRTSASMGWLHNGLWVCDTCCMSEVSEHCSSVSVTSAGGGIFYPFLRHFRLRCCCATKQQMGACAPYTFDALVCTPCSQYAVKTRKTQQMSNHHHLLPASYALHIPRGTAQLSTGTIYCII